MTWFGHYSQNQSNLLVISFQAMRCMDRGETWSQEPMTGFQSSFMQRSSQVYAGTEMFHVANPNVESW